MPCTVRAPLPWEAHPPPAHTPKAPTFISESQGPMRGKEGPQGALWERQDPEDVSMASDATTGSIRGSAISMHLLSTYAMPVQQGSRKESRAMEAVIRNGHIFLRTLRAMEGF